MGTEKKQDTVLKPGTIFEKYTIEKLLGRGGMGAVYLVRHNVLDSLFALKVLFPNVAEQNKQFVDRFIREAKLACKIRHPNLIAVHDAGKNSDNGMYYIVMDYVSGGSVRDLLKREPRLYPQDALRIITQIAGALVAAHAHHMVHRDIKPDNIMFTEDGTAKLADLGIAKSTDEQDTMLTMASSVFGTPAYMSPEQAMDSSKVDSRADIYSLGIVFYEMLAGQRPYRGDSTIQILSQVVADTEVPDIRKICPKIPSELAELISEMTAKKLSKRIPDPENLLQRLKAIHIPNSPPQARAERGVSEGADITLVTQVKRGGNKNENTAPGQASDGNVSTERENPAEVTIQTLVKHPGRQEPPPPHTPSSAKTDKDGVDSGLADEEGQTSVNMPDRTIPMLIKKRREPEKNRLSDSTRTNGSAGGIDEASSRQDDIAAESEKSSETVLHQKQIPPERENQQVERGNSNSPFKQKKTFWLLCAALVIVIIFCLSYSLLKSGKKAEKISPAAPARENAPTVSVPPTTAKKTDSASTAVNVKTADSTGVLPNKEGKTSTSLNSENVKTQKITTPPTKPEPTIPAPESSSATTEIESDPLSRNQIVLLAGDSEYTLSLKKMLSQAFGNEKTAFRLAESMGGYKDELKAVIRSSPSVVIIGFTDKYAEDRISKATFENIIRYHADLLRDNAIPFLFILSPEDEDNRQQRFFNEAVEELCKLKSIPLLKHDKQFESNLTKLIKGIMVQSN